MGSWKNYVCPQLTYELLISKLVWSDERVKAQVGIIQLGITSRKLYIKQDFCSKINKKFQVERYFEEFPIETPESGSQGCKENVWAVVYIYDTRGCMNTQQKSESSQTKADDCKTEVLLLPLSSP